MNTTVNPPKARLTVGQKIIVAVIAFFIVMTGIAFIAAVVEAVSTPTFTDLSEIGYDELESGEYYYIDNALILDAYAEITNNDKTSEMYYIVMSADGDDEIVYTSLRLLPHDDIYEKLSDYHADKNMNIGDLVISVYCKCAEYSTLETDIRRYYKEAYDEYSESIRGEYIQFSFEYIATTESEFIDSIKGEAGVFAVIDFIVFGALIAGLAIYLHRRKQTVPPSLRVAPASPAEEANLAALLDGALRSFNASGRTDPKAYNDAIGYMLRLPMYVPCDPNSFGAPGTFGFMPLFHNGTDCAAVFTSPDKVPAEMAASTRRLYPSAYIKAAASLGKSVLVDPGSDTELWIPPETVANGIAPRVV